MEHNQAQAVLIRYYVDKASCLRGLPLAKLIIHAISNPKLFIFADILSVPSVALLEGTKHSKYLALLRLFAFGTWRDYTDTIRASKNPEKYLLLRPEQILKLRQLSVLSAAKQCKVLFYDTLMAALDILTVGYLEVFLIHSCISVGIVKGNLYPPLGCIGVLTYCNCIIPVLDKVEYAAARDPFPNQLWNIFAFIFSWPASVQPYFGSLEERVKPAKGKVEDVQENIKRPSGKEDEKLQSHQRQADKEAKQSEPKRMRQKTP